MALTALARSTLESISVPSRSKTTRPASIIWIADCGLLIADCWLPNIDCRILIAECSFNQQSAIENQQFHFRRISSQTQGGSQCINEDGASGGVRRLWRSSRPARSLRFPVSRDDLTR